MSREGLRKFSEYSFARLAKLDPSAGRVAIRHDVRQRISLEDTSLSVIVDCNGRRGVATLEPAVLVEGAETLPAFPPAGPGYAWTLLGIRADQLARTREIQRLMRIASSPLFSKAAMVNTVNAMRLAEGLHCTERSPVTISLYGLLDLVPHAPEAAPALPVSLWLLIDPKDGYFELIHDSPWPPVR